MNPKMLLQQMLMNNPNVKNNPIVQNAMQMAQSGNVKGMQELAQNLANSKGVNIEDIKKQIETNLQIKL